MLRRFASVAQAKPLGDANRGWAPRVLHAYLETLRLRLSPANSEAMLPSVARRHQRIRDRLVSIFSDHTSRQDPASRTTEDLHNSLERVSMATALRAQIAVPPAVAVALMTEYGALSKQERTGLLALVADDLSTADRSVLRGHAQALIDAIDAEESEKRRTGSVNSAERKSAAASNACSRAEARLLATQATMRRAVEPLYMPLLTALARQSGGLRTLMAMREDVQDGLKHMNMHASQHAAHRESIPERLLEERIRKSGALRRLANDLTTLLRFCFSGSSLELREITPAAPRELMSRIAQVSKESSPQPVQTVEELVASRLKPCDRKVYAFFHPQMIDDPLVFVDVALMNHAPVHMDEILQRRSNERTDACTERESNGFRFAVFYSITLAHVGLGGLDLGGDLIKRVAELNLLGGGGRRGVYDDDGQPSGKHVRLITMSPMPGFRSWAMSSSNRAASGMPRGREADNVARVAAQYIVHEKKRGRALDPVANFHLQNGARVARILPYAQRPALQEKRQDGASMSHLDATMVSYEYDPGSMEQCAASYALRGAVTTSEEVKQLLGDVRSESQ